jgi:hypothetical protein
MYDASDEPRLDETWMDFYGGEKRGLKRLSDLDEETSPQITVDGALHPQPPSAADTTPPPHSEPLSISKPKAEGLVVSSSSAEAQPAEKRPRPLLSSVGQTKKGRKTVAGEQPVVSNLLAAISATKRTIESKDNLADERRPELGPPSVSPDQEPTSFQEWSQRWAPWLKRGGSIKVCEAFFRLTHERGSADCFTSNSEIMSLTGLSRSQCIRNIHYLIEVGFLDELNKVNNREAKGTYYRFNLIPTSLNSPPS